MKNFDSRVAAAKLIAELINGKGSLSTQLNQYKNEDEYGLLQESCFGVCRWFFLLDQILSHLLVKPLKRKDADIRSLLLLGLYQLRELSIPDYAVINESVSTANKLKKSWAKSLVNAVLRNYLRAAERETAELALIESQYQYAHPQWLTEEIQRQRPEQWEDILRNNNLRPPMTLRVNLARTSRDALLGLFADAGIDASAGELSDASVYLQKPQSVTSLPGFEEGLCSVQDEASQLVAPLLRLEPNLRVLDACAAPGGKTCHILESESLLTSCTAIDNDSRRAARITENLQRLGLSAEVKVADAAKLDSWYDGDPFDRILLDAPCSATGVIRRHPDIKLLRDPQQIEKLQLTQQRILRSLWPCLKTGGYLLYTSCSVLRQENELAIAEFLQSTDNAKYEGIAADWGVECSHGRQLLPGASHGPDGFFYCLLRKV